MTDAHSQSPDKKQATPAKAGRFPLWKKLVFSVVTVAVIFGALELLLILFNVRPILYSQDPYVGFSRSVPLFVKRTGKDGRKWMATARNKALFFNPQQFPADKEKELSGTIAKAKQLEEIKEEVVAEKKDFESKFIDQFGIERKIYVLQTLWPGVLVGVNEQVRKIESRQRRIVVTLEEDQIEMKRLIMKEATGGKSDVEEEEEDEESGGGE